MKAFNPLHTACLLLINETAKEEEPEPNTVSKDKGHVGTCRQLCHSNALCPRFQAGLQYATLLICTSFSIFFFPFLCEETRCQHSIMHSCTGAGARAERDAASMTRRRGFDKIWKTNCKPVNLLMLHMLTRAGNCSNKPSLDRYSLTFYPWPSELLRAAMVDTQWDWSVVWCQWTKPIKHLVQSYRSRYHSS